MQSGSSDTIFAVATAPGRAALAVVRISGPASQSLVTQLCGRLPPPRRGSLRTLHDPAGVLLDRAVVLWMPGPASYTGEDSCELHLHGGLAVVSGVLKVLGSLGARHAGPGEFTRRAVVHGRMDLLEAEAVADLVEAETPAQRDQALRQLGGGLGEIYGGWAARLLRLLAQQEALIDFPDEDLPPAIVTAMIEELTALQQGMREHLDDDGRGERLRNGLVIAIAGPPNVGKSTLINALCQRDVAIVSSRAGTTRDVLEARVELAGVPVTLLDTAGLRETDDEIEAEGVRRARARVRSADLVLALSAGAETAWHTDLANDARVVRVVTKSDLLGGATGQLSVSAMTGAGMAELVASLENSVRALCGLRETPALSRARHRLAVEQTIEHVQVALAAPLPELCAEDMRLAVRSLGQITGSVGVEDVLDSVFGQFCIGK